MISICCLGSLVAVSGCLSPGQNDALSGPPFRFSHEMRFDDDTFSTSVYRADGTLFLGSYDACRLIDLLRREVIWEHRFPESKVSSDFLLHGSTLFAHVGRAYVTALNARTGKQMWKVDSPVASHPLSLRDGLLFCQLNTNELAALNIADGTRAWKVSIPSRTLRGRAEKPYMIGAPIMGSNEVVLALCDGRVMALRRDGRGTSWVFTLEDSETGGSFINDSLQIGDKVLIRSHSRTEGRSMLFALDLATGALRWKRDLDARAVRYEAPFCFAATGSNLVCLAAETGVSLWSADYERQPEEEETTSGEPVLRLHEKGVLLASGANVFFFSKDGEQRWNLSTRVAWSWCSPIVADKLLSVVGRRRIVFYEAGAPEPLPTSQAKRNALAERIVGSLESLSYEDERKLDILEGEAVPALIAEFKRLTPTTEDHTDEEIDRLLDCEGFISQYAQPQHSNLLAQVYSHDSTSGRFALDVLCKIGCQETAALLALDTLRHQIAASPDEAYFDGRCVELLTQVDHPRLTDFLAAVLKTGHPKPLLNAAYANLARNGTKEHIALVSKIQGKTHQDALISPKGLIAHWEMKATAEDSQRDSDGDGWSDGLEYRFGTNPKRADSDGDAQKDSEDWNPLAPPRNDLTQEELVLQAAFDARFRYTDAESLCIVSLPEGARTIEFTGRDWLTLCVAGPLPLGVADNIEKGAASVSFGEQPMTRWNSDRTEAVVNIRTYFGPLAATGYQITLRKIGNDWIPIRKVMTWIS